MQLKTYISPLHILHEVSAVGVPVPEHELYRAGELGRPQAAALRKGSKR
jgi:hypothetical protein